MMNETLAYADTPDNSAEQQKLYRIATAQRIMIWAVLSQLLLFLPYLNLIALALQLWAIYKLAVAMENRLAWLLTLGTILPVAGLVILLMTNAAATKYLRNAGLTVGLMGVKPETIAHLKAVR